MSVIIHGLNMPLCKTELIVFPSGVVQVYDSRENYLGKAQAVPLPEGHGRLIDADAMLSKYVQDVHGLDGIYDTTDLPEMLSYMPSIVQAEGGTDNEHI